MRRSSFASWRRPVFLAALSVLMMSFSNKYATINYDLNMKSELLLTTEPTMYSFGFLEIVIGLIIFTTLLSLVFCVLFGCPTLVKNIVIVIHIVVCIFIGILITFLFYGKPSLQEDEATFKNAISGYGKYDKMTEMIDTAQRLLKCCGAVEYTDWMKVNRTQLADSIIYEGGYITGVRVPKTCATRIDEYYVPFHVPGCVPLICAVKMDFLQSLSSFSDTLIFYEMMVILFIIMIFSDYEESEAIEEGKQYQDVTSDEERKICQDVTVVYLLNDLPDAFHPEDIHAN